MVFTSHPITETILKCHSPSMSLVKHVLLIFVCKNLGYVNDFTLNCWSKLSLMFSFMHGEDPSSKTTYWYVCLRSSLSLVCLAFQRDLNYISILKEEQVE